MILDSMDEDFGADKCEKKLTEAQRKDTETESHNNTEAQGHDFEELETNVLIKDLKKFKKKAIKKSFDVSAVSKTIRLVQKLSEPSVKYTGTFFPNFFLPFLPIPGICRLFRQLSAILLRHQCIC